MNGISRLRVTLHCDSVRFPEAARDAYEVARLPVVRDAIDQGLLDIGLIRLSL